MKRVIIFIN